MTLSRQEEQQDRLDYLRNEQRLRNQGSTFSQFAESEAAEDRGRYSAISNPTVIGAKPSPASQYPAGPAWCAGDQGLEPPFPVDISALETTGEHHELKASCLQLGPSILPPAQATASTPDTSSPGVGGRRGFSPPSFRRL